MNVSETLFRIVFISLGWASFFFVPEISFAHDTCSDIIASGGDRSSGYLVSQERGPRVAVLFDPSRVKVEEAESVVAEFNSLIALVEGALIGPKSLLINLQADDKLALGLPFSAPQVILPVRFSFPRSELIDSEANIDLVSNSKTIRLHEFSHIVFTANLKRDLPSFNLISKAVEAFFFHQRLLKRYYFYKEFVLGNMLRPAKLSKDDPRFERVQRVVNSLYRQLSRQAEILAQAQSNVHNLFEADAIDLVKKIEFIHELFADVLASVKMNSTAATRQVQEGFNVPKNSLDVLGRAFDRDISLEIWAEALPKSWQEVDAHIILAPVRFYLGPYLEKAKSDQQKKELMVKTYLVLRESVRRLVENKDLPTGSVIDFNKALIAEFETVLSQMPH